MKKILLFGMECLYMEVKFEVVKNLKMMEFIGNRCDIAQMQTNGKFIVFTEKELALNYLNSGNAVYYKGHIFFQEDKVQTSETYKKFKQKLSKIEKQESQIREEHISYLDGFLYESLKNSSQFAMVQSMINLYEMNIFSIQQLELKLVGYLKENTIQMVLNQIHESVKKAG